MQLAEALGIRAEDVRPVVGDTDAVGYSDVTGGSRVTFATGWAAYEAAQDVVRQMKERAAKLWETDAASVESSSWTETAAEDASSPDGPAYAAVTALGWIFAVAVSAPAPPSLSVAVNVAVYVPGSE